MRKLEQLTIQNYKSIKDQSLHLGALNVFIGGNGVGKSNLISLFRFLREVVTQNLTAYTIKKGGADSFLYFGRKQSTEMKLFLAFGEENESNSYEITLQGTDEDGWMIHHEEVGYHRRDQYPDPYRKSISTFSKESNIQYEDHICARQVRRDLEGYCVYHFHDTSDTAAVKGTTDVEDNRFLRPQAENLAAFLYWMQEKKPQHFANIEHIIRQVAPFFDGFRLAPSRLNESRIRLEWKEKGSDAYFNATALSDGTLRFMCLATLLMQPELPNLILLDEPELGLHPAAVVLLADLLSAASASVQVMVSTQSVTLVNQFEPADVWAVDRLGSQSVFRHLAEADMSSWLEGYALGELWEKNLLGARP
jgi:predicted ATPase